MNCRIFLLMTLLALVGACAQVARADESSSEAAAQPAATPNQDTSLVVLRNGEVLSGRVSREAGRTIVATEGAEIRLSPREVDFICQTLDEAYTIQHNRVVAGRIEDHLNLADWCLRHELLGYAAQEITEGMKLDPKDRRVRLLDAKLRRALLPTPAAMAEPSDISAAARPVSADELERLVRSLPAGTVESFTATIQPMLLNYCATAGCHGPNSSSSYTLLRAPLERVAARRLTERNLYNTLQWIDKENPLDSKLLSAAREPHGPNQASGITGVGTAKYQELASWVVFSSPYSFGGLGTSVAKNLPKTPASVAPAAGNAPVAALPSEATSVLASPAPATVLAPPPIVAKGTMHPRKVIVGNPPEAKSIVVGEKANSNAAAASAPNSSGASAAVAPAGSAQN
jgi:hypothetical protein